MNDKILLILDLDETLLHASASRLRENFDFQVFHYYVYQRPALTEFVRRMAAHFRLAVWSSASDDYVQAIVSQAFPADVPLEFVWGRSRCTRFLLPHFDEQEFYDPDAASGYEYAKRLKKVRRRGYDLRRVLIVDDTPEKVLHNYGNAVYMPPFTGADDDRELAKLADYLLTLKEEINVRTIEKRFWRTQPMQSP